MMSTFFMTPAKIPSSGEQLSNAQLARVRESLRKLRIKYFFVYAFASLGDWCQSVYLIRLLKKYGYSTNHIRTCFVIGFLSSAFLGTLAASLADRFGRKRLARCYFALSAASCVCVHNRAMWSIILSRVLGGVAMSLLMSTFESWFVQAHNEFHSGWLNESFSFQSFTNASTGILAVLFSEFLADKTKPTYGPDVQTFSFSYGGSVAPFAVSFFVLLIGAGIVSYAWDEVPAAVPSTYATSKYCGYEIVRGVRTGMKRWDMVLLCMCVSALDSAWFIWFVTWKPAMEQEHNPPSQFVFVALMSGYMVGSQIFRLLVQCMRVETIATVVFFVSSVSIALSVWLPTGHARFACFYAFLTSVGTWRVVASSLKSSIVEESMRTTVYSLFDVPSNLVVAFVLLNCLSIETTLVTCAVILVAGGVSSCFLRQQRVSTHMSATLVMATGSRNHTRASENERPLLVSSV